MQGSIDSCRHHNGHVRVVNDAPCPIEALVEELLRDAARLRRAIGGKVDLFAVHI